MATIDKTSVREQVEQLKQQFEQLRATGKVNDETQAVMAKVKQKVSGCFRQQEYAKAYCRISSYLQTMAHQGVNPLVAIQTALAGVDFESSIDRGE